LGAAEFMRRFLLHTLPSGLHRIRHYGLLANGNRKASLAAARELLGQVPPSQSTADDANVDHNEPSFVCRHCGAALIVVETLMRSPRIRAPPSS
ncbi:MAG: transposase, partial [Caldimonas sp.]